MLNQVIYTSVHSGLVITWQWKLSIQLVNLLTTFYCISHYLLACVYIWVHLGDDSAKPSAMRTNICSMPTSSVRVTLCSSFSSCEICLFDLQVRMKSQNSTFSVNHLHWNKTKVIVIHCDTQIPCYSLGAAAKNRVNDHFS